MVGLPLIYRLLCADEIRTEERKKEKHIRVALGNLVNVSSVFLMHYDAQHVNTD